MNPRCHHCGESYGVDNVHVCQTPKAKKETGGYAFPCPAGTGNDNGMTLRDYFAAHASNEDVKAYIYGPACLQIRDVGNGRKEEVRVPMLRTYEQARYAYADAMLEARK